MLMLVHVHQPSKRYGVTSFAFPVVKPGVTAYPSTMLVDSVRKFQEQISAQIFTHALKMCNNRIKVETLILERDLKDMICEISEQMNVDLLIIGSRDL